MCEATCEAMRVGFDRSIKLEFHGAKVSEDDELVTTRELDEILSTNRHGDEGVHLFSDPRQYSAHPRSPAPRCGRS